MNESVNKQKNNINQIGEKIWLGSKKSAFHGIMLLGSLSCIVLRTVIMVPIQAMSQ